MPQKSNNKITYLSEARELIKNRKKIIKMRKRKRIIKRIIFLNVIIISMLIILLLKLPYFNVKQISVIGNNNITSKEIIGLSNICIGNNIFYINSKECEKNILRNPYILNVKLKKQLPNKIVLDVNERKAALYVLKEGYYYIIDQNSVVLEKKESIKGMNLKRLIDTKNDKIQIGKVLLFDNENKVDIIKSLTKIINSSDISKNISMVDVKDIYDIKVYMGDLCIKLGDKDNLCKKFDKAVAIINKQNMVKKRGYIDVSYDGNPVIFIKK